MDINRIPKEVKDIIGNRDINNIMARVRYRNWRGETAARSIIPLNIYYGKTDFHPEEQWLMRVWDLDRADYRTYSVKDILEWL